MKCRAGRKPQDEADLSIAAIGCLLAGCTCKSTPVTNLISRPSPDDPTPSGIAYICEGRKEVAVVYAKNRASVTFGDKTWRTEYQPTGDGLPLHRYHQRMDGPRRLSPPCAKRRHGRPLAFNCRPTRRTDHSFSQSLIA